MPVRVVAVILGTVTDPVRRVREWIETTIVVSIFLLPLTMLTTLLLRPPENVRATLPPGPPRSSDVGADGRLPYAPALPEVQTGAGPPIAVLPGPVGMPRQMLDAYEDAAARLGRSLPGCGVPWPILAAIGKIESNHADNGNIDVNGTTVTAILGPRLSGGPGAATVPDTDGGRWDGDPQWDRAVGPMQLLPSAWAQFGIDGNDDGVASPHNVHDATVAAGRYLCSAGGDLRDPRNLTVALLTYNHSDSYVRAVLDWADTYAKAVAPVPPSAPAPARPPDRDALAGEQLPPAPAPQGPVSPSVTTTPTSARPSATTPSSSSPPQPSSSPPQPSSTAPPAPSTAPLPPTGTAPPTDAVPSETPQAACVPLPLTPAMRLCTEPAVSGDPPPISQPVPTASTAPSCEPASRPGR